MPESNLAYLGAQIKQEARALGFDQCAICHTDLQVGEHRLQQWLANKYDADMRYMRKHGYKRSRPQLLLPGTLRIISLRMNYLPQSLTQSIANLQQPQQAYISRYALGRDYHKLMRQRLKKLVSVIRGQVEDSQARIFVDSAPVLEKDIAVKAGLGWLGKHDTIIHRQQGSWFFLAEIYTNLPLPADSPDTQQNHCGRCEKCMRACPTGAIVAPYQVDARRHCRGISP